MTILARFKNKGWRDVIVLPTGFTHDDLYLSTGKSGTLCIELDSFIRRINDNSGRTGYTPSILIKESKLVYATKEFIDLVYDISDDNIKLKVVEC